MICPQNSTGYGIRGQFEAAKLNELLDAAQKGTEAQIQDSFLRAESAGHGLTAF
jgi:hypothetical protein